jgi:hypothetical protein
MKAKQWGGEDIRKGCRRVNMEEILCTQYVNGKMRSVETIPGMRGGGIMMEGVNSTMIYCKNFCKCHKVPLVQQ